MPATMIKTYPHAFKQTAFAYDECGEVRVRFTQGRDKGTKEKLIISNGDIREHIKRYPNGKKQLHVVYGKFEKHWDKGGRLVTDLGYHRNTHRGLHGKCMTITSSPLPCRLPTIR